MSPHPRLPSTAPQPDRLPRAARTLARRLGRALALTGVAGALVAAASLTSSPAGAAPTALAVDPPVATGIANPGLIHADGEWVTGSTGGYSATGTIHTAPELAGPWRSTGTRMLTAPAPWMSTEDKGTWAPSMVQASDGSYRLFFAAPVKQKAPNGASQRCIGAARADTARGPFVPFDRPVSCFSGSDANAYDTIANEAAGSGRAFSLIDATPATFGDTMVLTYKTSFVTDSTSTPVWHTTTRMVRLDLANPERVLPNPVNADGGSVKLTDARSEDIEENPVLVQRSGVYTLFTSYGLYGQCGYWTRWRQNTGLWNGWLSTTPTRLSFPASVDTCGTGNAHVTRGLPEGSWRIAFNGHPDADTSGSPTASTSVISAGTRRGTRWSGD